MAEWESVKFDPTYAATQRSTEVAGLFGREVLKYGVSGKPRGEGDMIHGG
jgi:hypothetical protein